MRAARPLLLLTLILGLATSGFGVSAFGVSGVGASTAHADEADRDAEVAHLQEIVRLLREQVRYLRTEVRALKTRVKALEARGGGEGVTAPATPKSEPPQPVRFDPSTPGEWTLDTKHIEGVLRGELEEDFEDMRAVVEEDERASLDALITKTVRERASRMRLELHVVSDARVTLKRDGRDDRAGVLASRDATWVLQLDKMGTRPARELVLTPDAAGGLRLRLAGEGGRELRLIRKPAPK